MSLFSIVSDEYSWEQIQAQVEKHESSLKKIVIKTESDRRKAQWLKGVIHGLKLAQNYCGH